MRIRIDIDGKTVVNNFPDADVLAFNLNDLDEEQKQTAKEDPTLFTVTLDAYDIPKLLIKAIKGMKRNEVSEWIINNPSKHIDRLKSNFTSKYFDQYAIFAPT